MSDKTAEIHREIGKKLSPVADMVILIKNSVTPYIAEGLKSSGYDQGRIVWFASSLAAHAGLQELLKPGDVILFQNDWPDNYL